MKNYNTPIEKIFFRSSKIGLLVGGIVSHGLTEREREEMDRLELIKKTPIGLTEKQATDLKTWNEKLENGLKLTPGQMEKRDDYKERLTKLKTLTPVQTERLEKLIEKNSRPPELSDGAKTYVKEVWLENEKGFREEITSKYLEKGLQGEEDALNLISDVDNRLYVKNSKRVFKDNLSGECDVKHHNKELDVDIIDDIKCCWNARTFMQSKLTTLYEWQGRAYLYLYDAEIFRLRFCLVDTPPDVYQEELFKFTRFNGIIDETLPEYEKMIKQFEANHFYEKSGKYSQQERVKTFMFERDYELEAKMLLAIKLGVEYYKTITLNMKE